MSCFWFVAGIAMGALALFGASMAHEIVIFKRLPQVIVGEEIVNHDRELLEKAAVVVETEHELFPPPDSPNPRNIAAKIRALSLK